MLSDTIHPYNVFNDPVYAYRLKMCIYICLLGAVVEYFFDSRNVTSYIYSSSYLYFSQMCLKLDNQKSLCQFSSDHGCLQAKWNLTFPGWYVHIYLISITFNIFFSSLIIMKGQVTSIHE